MNTEIDSPLNEIIRSLASELEKLSSRVELLEADNKLLRFELKQQSKTIDIKKAREMELRDSAFSQEINSTYEPRNSFTETSEHTVDDRLVSLEERLAYFEAKEALGDKQAVALTKCLCCMTPSKKVGRRPSNPGSGTNHSRFLCDTTALEVQQQQLLEQHVYDESRGPQKRAPRFGVESIRPRSRG